MAGESSGLADDADGAGGTSWLFWTGRGARDDRLRPRV